MSPLPGPHITLGFPARRPPDLEWLRRAATRALQLLRCRCVNLGVIVLDDRRMARMHRRFLGAAGTTDVITFDLRQPGSTAGRRIDAELYVCLDEARRQARARAIPVEHELLLYMVHGLLHLLGYDDHDPAGHRRMHRREDAILRRLGVGPVYHRPGTPSRG
jgi:probable rRNA maturation factor